MPHIKKEFGNSWGSKTINEKLQLWLEDFKKVFYDYDLKKYFTQEERSKYQDTILGLGKVMVIPLYIDFKELVMSNLEHMFNPRLLESISISISDSKIWPESFLQEYDNFEVLNLPYQRVGIKDIRLYNVISDFVYENEGGFVPSRIEIIAPEFHNYYTTSLFNITRIDTPLTDVKMYYEGVEITTANIVEAEYSDTFEVYFSFDHTDEPILFNNISTLSFTLTDTITGQVISLSNAYWVDIYDPSCPYDKNKNYYYMEFELPKKVSSQAYELKIDTLGTPIHDIYFDTEPTLTLRVNQEGLSSIRPIYLSDDLYQLEYDKDPLILKGAVLDNDQYRVEHEVYDYNYQEAFDDGNTIHPLRFVSPYEDSEYISTTEFSIYYVNSEFEKKLLYSTFTGSIIIDDNILDKDNPPVINYIDNTFVLEINWKQPIEIEYSTNLLVSYKVQYGRPISPVSYSSYDQFDNNRYDNLAEVPFARYDMINNQWQTEDDYIQYFSIDRVSLTKTIENKGTNIVIPRPQFEVDGRTITQEIIGCDEVYVNKSAKDEYELVPEANYTWYIDDLGQLVTTYYNYEVGDVLFISYFTYTPISLGHPATNIHYVNVTARDNKSLIYEFSSQEYYLSSDGYTLYLNISSILVDETFTIYDDFEISYRGLLARKIDLSRNLLLMVQDSSFRDRYIPIDTVEIDRLGLFEYEQMFTMDGPLSLPLGDKEIINMKLAYLPISVFDKAKGGFTDIIYTYETPGGDTEFRYPYKSDNWEKTFQIITIPKTKKIELIKFETQNMAVAQEKIAEREYLFNRNPFEMLEEGEEYTYAQLDMLVREDYTLTFKVTNEAGTGINDTIVWLSLGFMPKSKTKFLNERAIIEENEQYPYYEALGTDPFTYKGPGIGPNDKMFSRPQTFETYSGMQYGPYMWLYGRTDIKGEVSFELSLDHEYLNDFIEIFGSIEGINTIEDMVLYMKAHSSDFDWNKMALLNPEQYICSKDGNIYNGSEIIENYDFTNLKLQDSTYQECIVRLHKRDIALGITDYLSYDLPDITSPEYKDKPPKYQDLTVNLFVTEAEPIMPELTQSIESLAEIHDSNELEPLPESILNDGRSYMVSADIYNPSGYYVHHLDQHITPNLDSGTITITNYTMQEIIWKSVINAAQRDLNRQRFDYLPLNQPKEANLRYQCEEFVRSNDYSTTLVFDQVIDPIFPTWLPPIPFELELNQEDLIGITYNVYGDMARRNIQVSDIFDAQKSALSSRNIESVQLLEQAILAIEGGRAKLIPIINSYDSNFGYQFLEIDVPSKALQSYTALPKGPQGTGYFEIDLLNNYDDSIRMLDLAVNLMNTHTRAGLDYSFIVKPIDSEIDDGIVSFGFDRHRIIKVGEIFSRQAPATVVFNIQGAYDARMVLYDEYSVETVLSFVSIEEYIDFLNSKWILLQDHSIVWDYMQIINIRNNYRDLLNNPRI